ncbi:MAG: hypothetical protein HY080_08695 [Gammaproteobacteria bacterium]|nr:hypothetical protein [Gammaproteobacteria bacterium]
MSSEPSTPYVPSKYSVISVEKTDPPPGMTGDDWHRYVIGVGNSKMVGCKPGTLSAITEHARTVAEDLNARASRSGSVYAPRLKK